jgi:hypothetical protein
MAEDRDNCEDFIREILAALAPESWTADEIAETEREIERGEYEPYQWLKAIPGFTELCRRPPH